jgi:hypothetical protein
MGFYKRFRRPAKALFGAPRSLFAVVARSAEAIQKGTQMAASKPKRAGLLRSPHNDEKGCL